MHAARDEMLWRAFLLAQICCPYPLSLADSSPSSLTWMKRTIEFAVRIDHSDSLKPLLSCLTMYVLVPVFCVWYLDDVLHVCWGGWWQTVKDVKHDLDAVNWNGAMLHLNERKSKWPVTIWLDCESFVCLISSRRRRVWTAIHSLSTPSHGWYVFQVEGHLTNSISCEQWVIVCSICQPWCFTSAL